MEAVIRRYNEDAAQTIIGKYWGVANERSYWWTVESDNKQRFVTSDDGSNAYVPKSTNTVDADTFHYVAIVKDSTTVTFYLDGIADGSGNAYGTLKDNVNYCCIGAVRKSDGTVGTYMDGIIDESTISYAARPAAWIKATHYGLWDALLTYGDEETEAVSGANILFIFSDF